MSSWRPKKSVAAMVILAVTGGTTFAVVSLVGAEGRGYAPDPQIVAAEGQTIADDSLLVRREFEQPPGVVRWTVVTYVSSDGVCLDVYGELVSGQDSAKVGGCGTPDGPFRLGVGWIELAGQPYSVVYGEPPPGASVIRIELADGTTAEAAPVNGVFAHVIASHVDVTLAEAVDSLGNIVASQNPASLSQILGAAATAEGGTGGEDH